MKTHIVMTLPRWDDVTEYLSAFSKEIFDKCKKVQIPITLVEKEKVTQKGFQSSIRKNTRMFILNGHGSPNCICGHKNEKIISLGINEDLLDGKITYARSCWAFSKLGQICLNKKEQCFVGYFLPFQFIIEPKWIINPLKDKTAKIFFDTSNLVPMGLIKENTVGESHENSKKSMLKAMNKILKKGERGNKAILRALWNNYESQKIVGNENLRL